MELFYQHERDKDFFEICEAIRKEKGSSYISVSEIVRQAINQPAKSFYLHIREYTRIYKRAKNGRTEGLKASKKALYNEVYSRYSHILTEQPNLCAMAVARLIAEQPAPRFYISPAYGADLYYKLLKSKNL